MKLKIAIICTILVLPMVAWGSPNIVPLAIKNNKEFHLAADFLEQYAKLLNAEQTEEVKEMIRMTKDNGFSYIIGNDSQFRRLNGLENFSIELSDYKYKVHWSSNGKKLIECIFPANIGLLTFTNKIDLENQMIERLNASVKRSVQIKFPICDKENLKMVSLSDFYIEDNGFYITPILKNQMIYESIPSDSLNCQMLINSECYQLESLSNMMLSGYSLYPQMIKLNINQYGYKNSYMEIPLSNLFQFLTDENCKPYWGVDSFDGNMVKGVLVWVNTYGGYAHMIMLNIPIDVISKPTTLTAKLHCYLRLDNLKSLFEEYEAGQKKSMN